MHLSRSSYAPTLDHIADCVAKTQSDRRTSIVDFSGSFGERALGAQSKCCLVIDRYRLDGPLYGLTLPHTYH